MIYSKKRELVLNFVRAARTHPTADEVYAGLQAGDAGVSLATVYRNLNQLAEGGLLRRIADPTGPDRFDGNLSPHMHAVCTRCGRMVDVPAGPLPDLCGVMNAHTDMEITGVTLVFHGICSACGANNKHTDF